MKLSLYCYLVLSALFFACQSKADKSGGDQSEPKSEMTNYSTNFSEGIPMLIGTYTQDMGWVNGKASGIHIAVLKNGKVELVETVDVGPNPSYIAVHPNKNFAYAVNEVGGTEEFPEGKITAFSIGSEGQVEIINTRPSLGTSPCHVSLNTHGTQLLVANYGSGTIASFPIGLEGRTGRRNDVVQFKGKGDHPRQEGSHAHFIQEGFDKKIYSADLGTDSIRIYNLNGGQLEFESFFKTESQGGPRHLAFHGSLPLIYILNELNGTVEVWKKENSSYTQMETVLTLPDDLREQEANGGAIKISSDNKNLYVTNRGSINAISTFGIADDGKISLINMTSTQGKIPRDMEIDPSGQYLIVANQDSDNIVTFEIDQSTGELQNPKETKDVPTPVCIRFL